MARHRANKKTAGAGFGGAVWLGVQYAKADAFLR
jgi:hypothetical protein